MNVIGLSNIPHGPLFLLGILTKILILDIRFILDEGLSIPDSRASDNMSRI